MTFLINHWYAAAWSNEVGEMPLARRILDRPIVFYRTSEGEPVALHDACPHRFAPLSLGRVRGSEIICGYHGLVFGASGRCVGNPHGKGITAAALAVRRYPLVERYGIAWIWIGDTEADFGRLPVVPSLETPDLAWVRGALHVSVNYQLMIDNLLDLTHVEYLHPFLSAPPDAPRPTTRIRAEQDGDCVSSIYEIEDAPVSDLFALFWPCKDRTGTMHVRMDWSPPAILSQNNSMHPADADPATAVQLPFAHLLTPETEDSTHYFWLSGRAARKEDEQLSHGLAAAIQSAFAEQDEPMIRAVRSRMESNDLLAHRPAALPMDEASIRARRVVDRLAAAAGRESARSGL